MRRAEVTLNHAEEFRVYRRKEGDTHGPKQWRALRRGEVCQKINERYVAALARVDDDTTLEELTRPLEQPDAGRASGCEPCPASFQPRRSRLAPSRQPWRVRPQRLPQPRPAAPLLSPADRLPQRNDDDARSAKVSRQLRLLRAHGLIRKVAGAHRYHVTPYGRNAITPILTAQQATLNQFMPKAA